jgi:hypothetical protein
MKTYEYLDMLVTRAWRSPANSKAIHYVKLSESDILKLSEAAEELYAHDPESMRGVPDEGDADDDE